MDEIVDWDAWYYTEGQPPEPVAHDGSTREACERLAADYVFHSPSLEPGQLASWAGDAHLLIAFATRLAEIAKRETVPCIRSVAPFLFYINPVAACALVP